MPLIIKFTSQSSRRSSSQKLKTILCQLISKLITHQVSVGLIFKRRLRIL